LARLRRLGQLGRGGEIEEAARLWKSRGGASRQFCKWFEMRVEKTEELYKSKTQVPSLSSRPNTGEKVIYKQREEGGAQIGDWAEGLEAGKKGGHASLLDPDTRAGRQRNSG